MSHSSHHTASGSHRAAVANTAFSFARVDSFSLIGQAESNLASANKSTQIKSEQQSRQQWVSLILLLALSNISDALVCRAAKLRSPSLPKQEKKGMRWRSDLLKDNCWRLHWRVSGELDYR